MKRASTFVLTAAVIAGIAFGFAFTPAAGTPGDCARTFSAAVLFF